ncbi:hypothetical protein EZV62_018942 [Acer yangbiense]|uniref:Pentacotripeptide-repeat region of PRORP domain-containing protein n=1 Tax=Acer yangbiense TaxID=1000413 RepID=A0A5C7HBY7_9ROSI|nr:hypothetical protein EZV62_018942 [Acer yangbiense]
MTALKALLSPVTHSRASIPRNGFPSLFKLFTTSHPKSMSKDSDRARLRDFIHGKCKSGKIDLDEALYFFDYMIHMQPTPPISCFSILFNALLKNNHSADVISLQKRLNSAGLVLDLISLNILINCFSNTSRVCDDFVVFGAILRRGFNPSVVTFCSLIKGLCMEGRIMEATRLVKKMVTFGCRPDVVTYGTLIHGLCRTGHTIVALQLHEQMVNGNGKVGDICKPNVVWYNSIIDGLCKDGFTDKAKELFSEMKGNGIPVNAVTYNCLIHGLCCVGDWEEAKSLYIEMLNQGVQPTTVTFSVLLDELCKNGKMNEANKLYKLMIRRGVQPNTYTYNILMDGYCLVGRIHDAKKLFVSMEKKGVYA